MELVHLLRLVLLHFSVDGTLHWPLCAWSTVGILVHSQIPLAEDAIALAVWIVLLGNESIPSREDPYKV